MFDQVSVGIVVCDWNWCFIWVNDCYCEIVGCLCEILFGLCMQDIFDFVDFVFFVVLGGVIGVVFEMSGCYVCFDGDMVWVQNQVMLLVDEQYVVSGLFCVCMDISVWVCVENELCEFNESLEECVVIMFVQCESVLVQFYEVCKMEMVGQLIGGIVYDFNNLLMLIMVLLELICWWFDDVCFIDFIDGVLQFVEWVWNFVGCLFIFVCW